MGPPHYNDGAGAPDSEGNTVGPDGAVYLATERDNSVSGVSKNAVLRYEPGTSMSAGRVVAQLASPQPGRQPRPRWHQLDPGQPPHRRRLRGREHDRVVRPGRLRQPRHPASRSPPPRAPACCTSSRSSRPRPCRKRPTRSPRWTPQLQTNTGPPGAMDVTWDPEQARLWAVCDDSCDGTTVTMELDESGEFVVDAAYDRPLGMPNLNNEDLATAPRSTSVDGRKEVLWTDDGDTDGHSLRSGTITCDALPTTPVRPVAPLPAAPVTPVTPIPTTPVVGPVAKQVAEISTARKTVRGATGERIKVRLKEGRAVAKLPRFARAGTEKVVVTYLGNETTTRATLKVRAVIRG